MPKCEEGRHRLKNRVLISSLLAEKTQRHGVKGKGTKKEGNEERDEGRGRRREGRIQRNRKRTEIRGREEQHEEELGACACE